MIRKLGMTAAALVLSFTLAACGNQVSDADQRQAEATEKLTNDLDRKVGMPAIVHGTEKKMARDIYELRDDPNISTFAYTQSLDGKFHCVGRALGYGLPYSTQFSNPQVAKWHTNKGYLLMPQPEPNGLFVPEGMSATWVNLINPTTGEPSVVYMEPTLTVSPFEMSGPIVGTPCK